MSWSPYSQRKSSLLSTFITVKQTERQTARPDIHLEARDGKGALGSTWQRGKMNGMNYLDSDSQGVGHEALKALVLSLRFLLSIQPCVYVHISVHMNAETLGVQKSWTPWSWSYRSL